MTLTSDTKRPGSVKAEFDPDFRATSQGGAVLLEQTVRSLKIRRYVKKCLPARSKDALYATEEVVMAIVQGLILGGRGQQAVEGLREDDLLAEIVGQGAGAPSPSTVYRVLCEIAGIPAARAFKEWYEKSGPRMARLDISGEEKALPATHRQVPDVPEAASPENLAAMAGLLKAVAMACARALPTSVVRTAGFAVVFGDATDLEVEGRCFDAARVGRDGKEILRWLTLMSGPILVGQRLMPGNHDEGASMPSLLEECKETVRELAGRKTRILALLDAAYFEWPVVGWLLKTRWHFIIGANQQRDVLTRLAQEQPAEIWTATGPDAGRGWKESEVACFTYGAANWGKTVTIVARRWLDLDDLPGMWRYTFVGTDLEESDLPEDLVAKHGYAPAIWMLYGTKQGRENHYKTSLEDLGLHHPPSGRLGLAQVFYVLGSVAHNIAMVLRYRVAQGEDRGITLWRLRERYFAIAGTLVRRGRTLLVKLSAVVDSGRQTLWRAAFAEAGRI
jgi:hypothetical protein